MGCVPRRKGSGQVGRRDRCDGRRVVDRRNGDDRGQAAGGDENGGEGGGDALGRAGHLSISFVSDIDIQ